ncbi:MAG: circadian phase modifier CpmA [Gammaproteobacteria bacterium]|nr:circadian phase modifier CpmA [Gammaproteobacteria bacterium]
MTEEIRLDFDRVNRTGVGEAIFCAGKSDAQLREIARRIAAADKPMLFTRLTPEQVDVLGDVLPADFDYDPVSCTGFHRRLGEQVSHHEVAVITGGSADVPVAREASRTLAFYGHEALDLFDVGVAGLWRLTEHLETIRRARIVIAVAGMEAALPTVLAGLIGSSIIAVPTSVGYGVAGGGRAALNSLLASCASGISVVNIDNGYGAACVALRGMNQLQK